jgi:hypothetical protein
MRRLVISALIWLCADTAAAQLFGPRPEPTAGFSQNSISNLGALGDTLWVGPLLNREVGRNGIFVIPENADSIVDGNGRLFSIALAPDTVFAGIAWSKPVAGTNVQTAIGFYLSTDGGDEWRFIPPPLDDPNQRKLRYGPDSIGVLPIVVPEQSPAYNVALRGDVLVAAAWASGIRRSRDFGRTWERIILPPFELDSLSPDRSYDFVFDPRVPQAGSPNLPKYPDGWQNFLGFSVMIDRDGHVWAGTAGGINISDNALTATPDRIRWRHVKAGASSTSMLGNWVIRMRENPADGRVWLTNWITNTGERQGLVSTDDGGRTFRHHLIDERINDIGFDGSVVFAAGESDLHISRDNGLTWEQQTGIASATARLRSDAAFRSVATGRGVVHIGSSDGLISTDDGGLTWDIRRVDFPFSGGNQFAPNDSRVRSYAYPNPFSRTQHGVVRIRFEARGEADIRIQLLDFGMVPFRILTGRTVAPGVYEAEWDGLDGSGRHAANGPVFYRVTGGGTDLTGKIMVLD